MRKLLAGVMAIAMVRYMVQLLSGLFMPCERLLVQKQKKDIMRYLACIAVVLLTSLAASATPRYVVPAGTPGVVPGGGYISWATAATNIQQAVDVAVANDTIYVTNGTYFLTNDISVSKALTIQSYHDGNIDPDNTIINGNYPNNTTRCFTLSSSVVLDGFTITNAHESTSATQAGIGGGILMYNAASTVKNCRIMGNVSVHGGGIYIFEGTGNMVTNCTISGNIANNTGGTYTGGGGVFFRYGGEVRNCVISDNSCTNSSSPRGGGVYVLGGTTGAGIVRDCVISGNSLNSASGLGGGVNITSTGQGCLVSDCEIYGNSSSMNGGGVYLGGGHNGLVQNCVVSNNVATYGGGVFFDKGGSTTQTVRNCLIVGNNDSGIWVFEQDYNRVENCTIANNTPYGFRGRLGKNVVLNSILYSNATDVYEYNGDTTWSNCCISSLPTKGTVVDCITANPNFAGGAANWRLLGTSPAINQGAYLSWMDGSLDLDGKKRINDGTVDMGAYEFYVSGTLVILR